MQVDLQAARMVVAKRRSAAVARAAKPFGLAALILFVLSLGVGVGILRVASALFFVLYLSLLIIVRGYLIVGHFLGYYDDALNPKIIESV